MQVWTYHSLVTSSVNFLLKCSDHKKITVEDFQLFRIDPKEDRDPTYIEYVARKCLFDLRETIRVMQAVDLNKADALLVQNPPMVPVILYAWAYLRFGSKKNYKTRILVDYHNFSYSIL